MRLLLASTLPVLLLLGPAAAGHDGIQDTPAMGARTAPYRAPSDSDAVCAAPFYRLCRTLGHRENTQPWSRRQLSWQAAVGVGASALLLAAENEGVHAEPAAESGRGLRAAARTWRT